MTSMKSKKKIDLSFQILQILSIERGTIFKKPENIKLELPCHKINSTRFFNRTKLSAGKQV